MIAGVNEWEANNATRRRILWLGMDGDKNGNFSMETTSVLDRRHAWLPLKKCPFLQLGIRLCMRAFLCVSPREKWNFLRGIRKRGGYGFHACGGGWSHGKIGFQHNEKMILVKISLAFLSISLINRTWNKKK